MRWRQLSASGDYEDVCLGRRRDGSEMRALIPVRRPPPLRWPFAVGAALVCVGAIGLYFALRVGL